MSADDIRRIFEQLLSLAEKIWKLPFVETIAETAVIAVLGWAIYKLSISKFRGHWRLNKEELTHLRIVLGTFDRPTSEYGYSRSLTTTTDASAAMEIASSLALAYRGKCKLSTVASDNFHAGFWEDSVALVGGRVRNAVTNELLNRLSYYFTLPYEIRDIEPGKQRVIFCAVNNKEYSSLMDGDNIIEDWGVVARLPNPFTPNDNDSVFMFYGLHSFGTSGCAKLLRAEHGWSLPLSIRKSVFFSRHYMVLVNVVVDGDETTPIIVEVLPVLKKVNAS